MRINFHPFRRFQGHTAEPTVPPGLDSSETERPVLEIGGWSPEQPREPEDTSGLQPEHIHGIDRHPRDLMSWVREEGKRKQRERPSSDKD
jgi:hypothetical protein